MPHCMSLTIYIYEWLILDRIRQDLKPTSRQAIEMALHCDAVMLVASLVRRNAVCEDSPPLLIILVDCNLCNT